MPASYDHHWSISRAWKDWKAACVGFADSDVCSGDELNRRAIYLGIPVAQLRWVRVTDPTRSVSWSVAWMRFRSIQLKSRT